MGITRENLFLMRQKSLSKKKENGRFWDRVPEIPISLFSHRKSERLIGGTLRSVVRRTIDEASRPIYQAEIKKRNIYWRDVEECCSKNNRRCVPPHLRSGNKKAYCAGHNYTTEPQMKTIFFCGTVPKTGF